MEHPKQGQKRRTEHEKGVKQGPAIKKTSAVNKSCNKKLLLNPANVTQNRKSTAAFVQDKIDSKEGLIDMINSMTTSESQSGISTSKTPLKVSAEYNSKAGLLEALDKFSTIAEAGKTIKEEFDSSKVKVEILKEDSTNVSAVNMNVKKDQDTSTTSQLQQQLLHLFDKSEVEQSTDQETEIDRSILDDLNTSIDTLVEPIPKKSSGSSQVHMQMRKCTVVLEKKKSSGSSQVHNMQMRKCTVVLENIFPKTKLNAPGISKKEGSTKKLESSRNIVSMELSKEERSASSNAAVESCIVQIPKIEKIIKKQSGKQLDKKFAEISYSTQENNNASSTETLLESHAIEISEKLHKTSGTEPIENLDVHPTGCSESDVPNESELCPESPMVEPETARKIMLTKQSNSNEIRDQLEEAEKSDPTTTKTKENSLEIPKKKMKKKKKKKKLRKEQNTVEIATQNESARAENPVQVPLVAHLDALNLALNTGCSESNAPNKSESRPETPLVEPEAARKIFSTTQSNSTEIRDQLEEKEKSGTTTKTRPSRSFLRRVRKRKISKMKSLEQNTVEIATQNESARAENPVQVPLVAHLDTLNTGCSESNVPNKSESRHETPLVEPEAAREIILTTQSNSTEIRDQLEEKEKSGTTTKTTPSRSFLRRVRKRKISKMKSLEQNTVEIATQNESARAENPVQVPLVAHLDTLNTGCSESNVPNKSESRPETPLVEPEAAREIILTTQSNSTEIRDQLEEKEKSDTTTKTTPSRSFLRRRIRKRKISKMKSLEQNTVEIATQNESARAENPVQVPLVAHLDTLNTGCSESNVPNKSESRPETLLVEPEAARKIILTTQTNSTEIRDQLEEKEKSDTSTKTRPSRFFPVQVSSVDPDSEDEVVDESTRRKRVSNEKSGLSAFKIPKKTSTEQPNSSRITTTGDEDKSDTSYKTPLESGIIDFKELEMGTRERRVQSERVKIHEGRVRVPIDQVENLLHMSESVEANLKETGSEREENVAKSVKLPGTLKAFLKRAASNPEKAEIQKTDSSKNSRKWMKVKFDRRRRPYLCPVEDTDNFEEENFAKFFDKTLFETALIEICTRQELKELVEKLKTSNITEIGINFELFFDQCTYKISVLEISTTDEDYLIDALALDGNMDVLVEIFLNSKIRKIFEYDNAVAKLQYHFGVEFVNVFVINRIREQADRAFTSLQIVFVLNLIGNQRLHEMFYNGSRNMRPLSFEQKQFCRFGAHYLVPIYRSLMHELLKHKSEREILWRKPEKMIIFSHEKQDDYLELMDEIKKLHEDQLRVANELDEWRHSVALSENLNAEQVLRVKLMKRIALEMPDDIGVMIGLSCSTFVSHSREVVFKIINPDCTVDARLLQSKSSRKNARRARKWLKRKEEADALLFNQQEARKLNEIEEKETNVAGEEDIRNGSSTQIENETMTLPTEYTAPSNQFKNAQKKVREARHSLRKTEEKDARKFSGIKEKERNVTSEEEMRNWNPIQIENETMTLPTEYTTPSNKLRNAQKEAREARHLLRKTEEKDARKFSGIKEKETNVASEKEMRNWNPTQIENETRTLPTEYTTSSNKLRNAEREARGARHLLRKTEEKDARKFSGIKEKEANVASEKEMRNWNPTQIENETRTLPTEYTTSSNKLRNAEREARGARHLLRKTEEKDARKFSGIKEKETNVASEKEMRNWNPTQIENETRTLPTQYTTSSNKLRNSQRETRGARHLLRKTEEKDSRKFSGIKEKETNVASEKEMRNWNPTQIENETRTLPTQYTTSSNKLRNSQRETRGARHLLRKTEEKDSRKFSGIKEKETNVASEKEMRNWNPTQIENETRTLPTQYTTPPNQFLNAQNQNSLMQSLLAPLMNILTAQACSGVNNSAFQQLAASAATLMNTCNVTDAQVAQSNSMGSNSESNFQNFETNHPYPPPLMNLLVEPPMPQATNVRGSNYFNNTDIQKYCNPSNPMPNPIAAKPQATTTSVRCSNDFGFQNNNCNQYSSYLPSWTNERNVPSQVSAVSRISQNLPMDLNATVPPPTLQIHTSIDLNDHQRHQLIERLPSHSSYQVNANETQTARFSSRQSLGAPPFNPGSNRLSHESPIEPRNPSPPPNQVHPDPSDFNIPGLERYSPNWLSSDGSQMNSDEENYLCPKSTRRDSQEARSDNVQRRERRGKRDRSSSSSRHPDVLHKDNPLKKPRSCSRERRHRRRESSSPQSRRRASGRIYRRHRSRSRSSSSPRDGRRKRSSSRDRDGSHKRHRRSDSRDKRGRHGRSPQRSR